MAEILEQPTEHGPETLQAEVGDVAIHLATEREKLASATAASEAAAMSALTDELYAGDLPDDKEIHDKAATALAEHQANVKAAQINNSLSGAHFKQNEETYRADAKREAEADGHEIVQ